MRIGLSTSVIGRGYSGIAQYVLALVRAYVQQMGPHQLVLYVLEDDLPLFEFARDTMKLVPVMACGRPVICSNGGALAEVAGTAAAMFDPRDTRTLTENLKQLAADEALRDAYGAAGLVQAKRFTWQATARQTLDVYARTAEQRSHRGAACSVLHPASQR